MDAVLRTRRAPGASLLRMVAAAGTRRWLAIARVGWIVLAGVVVAPPIAGIPLDFAQLRSGCADATACPATGQLTPEGWRLLQSVGLSLDLYATLSVAIQALAAAVWIAAAALVVWRRPGDRLALLTGWLLLAGSVGVADGSLRDAAPMCRE